MHVEVDHLRSSLEAVEVAVVEADQERVAVQAEIIGNYLYDCIEICIALHPTIDLFVLSIF